MGTQGATLGTGQDPPRKVIPQRANREILIRGRDLPADLAKRTPAEITQAINQASSQQGAIAARKMPSGDTMVTFKDLAAKEWHARNPEWIQKAFGEQAKPASKTFAVLIKGLRKGDLAGVTEETFGEETELQSVDRVKFRLPSRLGHTRATILVTLTSQEEAFKACEQGVVWNAQLLDCEPYWAVLEPKQCFKCWKWGHIQRYCSKPALCGRCGCRAHGEGGKAGEAQCPTHTGQLPYRCPNCGGRHPAWVKECQGRARAREGAREAYQYRPRAFEAPRETPLVREKTFTFSTPSQTEEDGGFQPVTRKRARRSPSKESQLARGRPTFLSVAGRDPTQTRINLQPAGSSPLRQVQQASQPSQPEQAEQTSQAILADQANQEQTPGSEDTVMEL